MDAKRANIPEPQTGKTAIARNDLCALLCMPTGMTPVHHSANHVPEEMAVLFGCSSAYLH